jgi:hypothetical protein
VYGFAEQCDVITPELVREVARERAEAGFFSMPSQEELEDSGVSEVGGMDNEYVQEKQSTRVEADPGLINSGAIIKHDFQKDSHDKIRVALASDSEKHLDILRALMVKNGIRVTALLSIKEQSLFEINHNDADVLLVDMDDTIELIPGHLDYLFDNLLTRCQIPVLFNDGAILDEDVGDNNEAFGRILASKLWNLVEDQKAV